MMRPLTLVVLVVGVLLGAAPAAAQSGDDGGSEFDVRVFTGSGPDREPVEGVDVTVTGDDGTVSTATTDDNGSALIAVAGAGTYEVAVDPATFPEGFQIEGEPSREVEVRSGERKVTNFRLAAAETDGVQPARSDTGEQSRFARLGSLAVAGLKLGAIIALAAIGLSLVFGVTGLVNFAHGELVTLGAVSAYFFNAAGSGPGWFIVYAAVPAIVAVAAFGWAQERVIWRPMRRRKAGNVSTLVVSIGLAFFLQYIVLWIFDGSPRPYHDYAVQRPMGALQPVNVEAKSIWIVAISVVVLVLVGLMLVKTRLGTAMRAVSDNPDLARSSGVDVDGVIAATWVMGAGLAALAGVLFGVSEQIHWQMGFNLLLAMFAAVVLGGLGTAFGAMLGGFVIGFVIEVSSYFIPTELKFAVGLTALVLMLLVRPQGLLGRRKRIG